MLGGGCRSQVQGEESLAWCHFWPTGCGVARAHAKEPRKKKTDRKKNDKHNCYCKADPILP